MSIPSAIILGVFFGFVGVWLFGNLFHGAWDLALGIAVGIFIGLVFGYGLGALLGETIFPTTNSPVESFAARRGMSITTRNGGRVFSFIRVEDGADAVELRVSPKYVDLLVAKLRTAGSA
ncbi:MAG: hypothetical protein WDM88_08050 [Galbitalea sp.]